MLESNSKRSIINPTAEQRRLIMQVAHAIYKRHKMSKYKLSWGESLSLSWKRWKIHQTIKHQETHFLFLKHDKKKDVFVERKAIAQKNFLCPPKRYNALDNPFLFAFIDLHKQTPSKSNFRFFRIDRLVNFPNVQNWNSQEYFINNIIDRNGKVIKTHLA